VLGRHAPDYRNRIPEDYNMNLRLKFTNTLQVYYGHSPLLQANFF